MGLVLHWGVSAQGLGLVLWLGRATELFGRKWGVGRGRS